MCCYKAQRVRCHPARVHCVGSCSPHCRYITTCLCQQSLLRIYQASDTAPPQSLQGAYARLVSRQSTWRQAANSLHRTRLFIDTQLLVIHACSSAHPPTLNHKARHPSPCNRPIDTQHRPSTRPQRITHNTPVCNMQCARSICRGKLSSRQHPGWLQADPAAAAQRARHRCTGKE